jgi:WD40 repeat protein
VTYEKPVFQEPPHVTVVVVIRNGYHAFATAKPYVWLILVIFVDLVLPFVSFPFVFLPSILPASNTMPYSMSTRHVPYISENGRIRSKTRGSFQHTPDYYQRRLRHACRIDFDRPVISFGPSPKMLTPKASPLKSVTETIAEPFKCLDFPSDLDDFYLNILDWSRKDIVATAMGTEVWIYDVAKNEPLQVYGEDPLQGAALSTGVPSSVRCLRWNRTGSLLAIGLGGDGAVGSYPDSFAPTHEAHRRGILLDTSTGQVKAKMTFPDEPFSLAWRTGGSYEFTCGTVGGDLVHVDLRQRSQAFKMAQVHAGFTSGLDWRRDGDVIASGGSDGWLVLRDIRNLKESLFQVWAHESSLKVSISRSHFFLA